MALILAIHILHVRAKEMEREHSRKISQYATHWDSCYSEYLTLQHAMEYLEHTI